MNDGLKNNLPPRENRCRHYKGISLGYLHRRKNNECALGRNLRQLFHKKYGPEAIGYLSKIPCNGSANPFCNCPDLDRKTDAEIADELEQSKLDDAWFHEVLASVSRIKKEMMEAGRTTSINTCPNCRHKTLHARLNTGGNNHIHAWCTSCQWGFME